ncbi:hypothetical protein AB0M43_38545 [Longispora sp. NPDC051575]|uniref:hypothetical protein n=1 Tax=Longispora sp. NPDC051575 TaxID=3154943 RepID=UPI00341C2BA4
MPLLLLTVGAVLRVSSSTPPVFAAQGALMLVEPTSRFVPVAGKPRPAGNAWTETGTVNLALATVISMETESFRASVESSGFDPRFKLDIVSRTAIITIKVASPSPTRSVDTVRHLLERVTADIAGKQQSLAGQPGAMITTEVLDHGGPVIADTTAVRRSQAVTAAAGVLGAVAVTVFFDGSVVKYRTRRRKGPVSSAPSGTASGLLNPAPRR